MSSNKQIIGNEVMVNFPQFNKDINSKVDTGATTSSLHANEIQINKEQNSVTFNCSILSDNSITMDLEGIQEVTSSDAGGQDRPIVKFDININGIDLHDITFNLNDRSEMDSPILIGQNILQQGHFLIDVQKDTEEEKVSESVFDNKPNKTAILNAIDILKENHVTIFDLVEFLRTAPLYIR